MTPEGKIEAYLRKRVLATGGRIRKMTWPGHRGAPDRMVWWPCRPGVLWPEVEALVFVEVKAPSKKATKQQQREHKKLRDDGFRVRVVDSREEVDRLILDNRDTF
jgi:hypothetical protein